ncbi:cysteine hydrolase [Cupriavidus pampae]|uniref:Peroxyureidoacrylate/ureidoacrylate amidohydrolase RutB n=1 Tax=Cupriavidus pampae TaxID=659251 RepID=A0ABM8WGU5_9BURK|nr:cysteine hydrolase [Cupriavidus pampae]CAG9166552.1 Peroxyureidoacrylate/ureidoacrylate amidohydrolase RutB [Cupriavidus pampae]
MSNQSYIASQTALLMVDPYNDFMTEGGKLYELIRPTAAASGMFDNLRKLIPAIRAAGIQIFVLPHHRSVPSDFSQWRHATPFQLAGVPGQAFARDSWGGEFNPEFGPAEGDIVVQEHWAQSGFANTDLDFLLKQRGIRRIILVGVIANSCIESTARFAVELGYHVTLVPDAAAAFSPEGMHAAFKVNGPAYAHAILHTEALIGRLPVAAS